MLWLFAAGLGAKLVIVIPREADGADPGEAMESAARQQLVAEAAEPAGNSMLDWNVASVPIQRHASEAPKATNARCIPL
jgi:hypothetical protein